MLTIKIESSKLSHIYGDKMYRDSKQQLLVANIVSDLLGREKPTRVKDASELYEAVLKKQSDYRRMPSKPLLHIGNDFIAVRNGAELTISAGQMTARSYDLMLAALLIEANTQTSQTEDSTACNMCRMTLRIAMRDYDAALKNYMDCVGTISKLPPAGTAPLQALTDDIYLGDGYTGISDKEACGGLKNKLAEAANDLRIAIGCVAGACGR
jgi:hypothetical protein